MAATLIDKDSYTTFCKGFCMFVIFLKSFCRILHSNKCSSGQRPRLTPSSTNSSPHTQRTDDTRYKHCHAYTRYGNYQSPSIFQYSCTSITNSWGYFNYPSNAMTNKYPPK